MIMSCELCKNENDVVVPCFRGTRPTFFGKEWETCNKCHSGCLVSVWIQVVPNTKKEVFPKDILWAFHVLDHHWLLGSPWFSSHLTSDLSSPDLNSPKHIILIFSQHILWFLSTFLEITRLAHEWIEEIRTGCFLNTQQPLWCVLGTEIMKQVCVNVGPWTLHCWTVAHWKEKYCVSARVISTLQCDTTALLCKFSHCMVLCMAVKLLHMICISTHFLVSEFQTEKRCVALVSTLWKEGHGVCGSRMGKTKNRMSGHHNWNADCCMTLLNMLEPTCRKSQLKTMWIQWFGESSIRNFSTHTTCSKCKAYTHKIPWKTGVLSVAPALMEHESFSFWHRHVVYS
jgi:hypothetical protein